MIHRYAVGEPYSPTRSHWPEIAQFQFRNDAHELVLFLATPQPTEIEAVREGPSSFALVVDGDVLFLLYRFGDGIPWSDAPYSIHRVPEAERTMPPRGLAADQRMILNLTLVDANNGIVRALRTVSWSVEFTSAIHAAIIDQAARPYPGDAEYDLQIADIYRRYPTTESLLAAASSRTEGGS